MASIRLTGVDLDFHVNVDRTMTLKSGLIRALQGRRNHGTRVIRALQSITLSVGSGERLGLIGANGAGKSTLLKTISGIYPPQRGELQVEGHVCPLFEFATGFEMEANGWDNIRTRALLLGMSSEEIEAKIGEIARFSNLGEFLDLPVRCYSSGMLLRLAFATSTAVDPQILLLDEVMSAGDEAFMQSARRRMGEFMERASIVVFASHSLGMLPSFCDRTILLDGGRIVADGPTKEVIRSYIDRIPSSGNAKES
jgi:lipopolysaccharide transport system ATP-binding protein